MGRSSQAPRRAVLLLFFLFTGLEVWAAAQLDLFGDEAFYWQCGQRPALAYVDHPPLTATMVRLGSMVAGDHPFGVRLLFLLMGAALPWAVFYLARPLVSDAHAWLAAGISLVLPAIAHLGLLAIPDVPMMLATALFLAFFERATRLGTRRNWILAGLAGAFGLLSHYRFFLAPAAALIYLFATSNGRRHLRNAGPLWMMLVALPGLLPAAWLNLQTSLGPLRYYFEGRHGFQVDSNAPLEHLAGQAILVTPLLYVAALATLVDLVRRAREGDDRAGLFAIFAATPLVLFFLASPFETSELATAHWPTPGYLALLPFMPGLLSNFASKGSWRRVMAASTPAVGGILLMLALVELATGALKLGAIREPFVGASKVAAHSRALLTEVGLGGDGRSVVVADNYKLGASLELYLNSQAEIFVLDHHKNRQHGRAPQLVEWGIDETALRQENPDRALVVFEVSQIRTGEHDAWVAHAATFFEGFERVGELELESPGKSRKKKVFWFYRAGA